MARQAALKEAAVVKKKRAEKAQRKHGKEMEITQRVRASENQSDVEAKLESEDPTEVGGDASSFEDEGSRSIIVTSVERRELAAVSAGGGWEAERRNDVPVSFIFGGAHVNAQLPGLLRLKLRLHVAPIFASLHPSGDLHLLPVPPPSLLSSLLLLHDRHLLQGSLPSHALRPLRKMRLGFITSESLRDG